MSTYHSYLPQQIAIIGQDQEEILQEVLKHTTVTQVDVYSIKSPFINTTGLHDVELTVHHNFGYVALGAHDVIIVTDAGFLEDVRSINAIHGALAENGVLVSIVGVNTNMKQLQETGFKSIHLYQEVCVVVILNSSVAS